MTDLELIEKFVKEEDKKEAITKLNNGYPIQYIIGNVEFFGNIIDVDETVLIPRFETEYLVEKTLNYLKKYNVNNPSILEVGIGSGCISISLKKNISCNILGIDISKNAVKKARENAIKNKVEVNFQECDIHKFKTEELFDLVISNPPYVDEEKEVDIKTKYEPQNAIFAKNNGLYYYEVIIKKIKNNLKNRFIIAFEIDDKQGNMIKKIVNEYFDDVIVIIEKDYNNYERYLFIIKE